MATRKTPKAKATPETTSSITIDGAEIQVPILVSNMLRDQRQTIDYLEHILLLWHYKQYDPNKDEISKDKMDYQNEMAAFIQQFIKEWDKRIEAFKDFDKKAAENVEKALDKKETN